MELNSTEQDMLNIVKVQALGQEIAQNPELLQTAIAAKTAIQKELTKLFPNISSLENEVIKISSDYLENLMTKHVMNSSRFTYNDTLERFLCIVALSATTILKELQAIPAADNVQVARIGNRIYNYYENS